MRKNKVKDWKEQENVAVKKLYWHIWSTEWRYIKRWPIISPVHTPNQKFETIVGSNDLSSTNRHIWNIYHGIKHVAWIFDLVQINVFKPGDVHVSMSRVIISSCNDLSLFGSSGKATTTGCPNHWEPIKCVFHVPVIFEFLYTMLNKFEWVSRDISHNFYSSVLSSEPLPHSYSTDLFGNWRFVLESHF